jgi:hypothetical protein
VKETSYPKFVNQQAITAFGTFAAEYADFAKAYAGMNYGKLKEFLNNADVFRRVSVPFLEPLYRLMIIVGTKLRTPHRRIRSDPRAKGNQADRNVCQAGYGDAREESQRGELYGG